MDLSTLTDGILSGWISEGVGPRDFEGLANAAGILVGASFAIDRSIWFIKQIVADTVKPLRILARWLGAKPGKEQEPAGRAGRWLGRLAALPPLAERWARREKDGTYYLLALLGGLAVSALGGIRALSLIDLAEASPQLDVVLTTVIVAFGGERLAALMGVPAESEAPPAEPEPPAIRIEGSLTVTDGDGKEMTLSAGS